MNTSLAGFFLRLSFIFGAMFSLVCPPLPAHGAVVNIPASADAAIYEDPAGLLANGSGDYLFAGANSGGLIRRSAMLFDVAAQIPSGAVVTQVVLRVGIDQRAGTVGLHRLTRAWGEGPSDAPSQEGAGTASETGDATWIHTFYNTGFWNNVGGDFLASPSAIASVASVPSTLEFQSSSLIADVQNMVNNPAGNFGWMVVNTDENSASSAVRMASRSNPTSASRPVLEVGYTTAPYPVLYYDFEEGAGTTITNKGRLPVHGTLFGIGGDARWTTGLNGGGLQFDGQNAPNGDYISTHLTAGTLGFNSPNYTAAAWMLFTKSTGDSMVFSQTNATSNVLHLGVRNSRTHLGHWSNDVTGATPLQVGVWYHVVWEYREGFQRIFLNGSLDVGPAVRGALANTSVITIGRPGYTNGAFQGILDDVAIFDGTLSYTQIRHLAEGGSPLSLPETENFVDDPSYFTAPFGPGGTWNLYQVRGTVVDLPRTWVDAETFGNTTVDPSGLTSVFGHLADIIDRRENYFLERISGFRAFWVGLTDNEAYGGTEAGNLRNGGWVWTSGLPFTYQNWSGSEPNNSTTGGEDGVLVLAGTGLWNDAPDGIPPQHTNATRQVYIVEWPVASSTPVPSAQIITPILPTPLNARDAANAAFGVTAVSQNGTLSHIDSAVNSLQSGNGTRILGKSQVINHTDPQAAGAVGLFVGDTPYVGDTIADDNHILHVYKGLLVVTNATVYTFGLRSDDGSALRFPGHEFSAVYGNGAIDPVSPDTVYRERGAGDFRAVISLPAGEHEVEVFTWETTGFSSHEFYAAQGEFQQDADTSLWRLVGHISRGQIPIPGIKTENGTNWFVRISAPGGNATITTLNNLANAETEMANDPNITQHSFDVLNFADPESPGGGGTYANNVPFPNNTAANDEDFALEASGVLEIPLAGLYQFGFRGDDGSRLRIVGQVWSNLAFAVNANSQIVGDALQFNALTGDSHTRGRIFLNAGLYDIRILYWERSGGANFEVYGDNDASPFFPRLLQANQAQIINDPTVIPLAIIEPVEIVDPIYNPISGQVTLSWSSMLDTTYTIQWSVDYTTWNLLQAGIPSQGATTTIAFPDTFPESFRVFRILEE